MKRFVFHNILNPTFAMDVQCNWKPLLVEGQKGTELLNKSMTDVIHTKLWKPQTAAKAIGLLLLMPKRRAGAGRGGFAPPYAPGMEKANGLRCSYCLRDGKQKGVQFRKSSVL